MIYELMKWPHYQFASENKPIVGHFVYKPQS